MAIPVYLQGFKAAGIYRVVFDHSAVLNTDTQILRLVVGYSEQGPFNTPVYVKDQMTFKQLFGDISKKLEKRGIYFHRLALQMLQVSPILCLNLKKFDGETVDGSTIATDFNPKFDPIDTVKLNVEDIYDTTRFWELDANQLNDLRSVSGPRLDQYINICTTNTKKTSATYFIRKANGQQVAGYNITVNDWYSDKQDDMPEYMEQYKNNLVSDFFAEIYVFKGKFTAKQVLSSDTLKNYFIITDEVDEEGEPVLRLRDKIIDSFGDSIDTLEMLYDDPTSNAIGHWTGCLIPYFKNKQGAYASLDIVFNSDIDTHNMMMSFNIDQLEEEESANIDLSGRSSIPTEYAVENRLVRNKTLTLDKIYQGTATTTVLGNRNAPVIADIIKFHSNVYDNRNDEVVQELYNSRTRVSGTLYVTGITEQTMKLQQVASDETITMVFPRIAEEDKAEVTVENNVITMTWQALDEDAEAPEFPTMLAAKKLGVEFTVESGVQTDSQGEPVTIVETDEEGNQTTYFAMKTTYTINVGHGTYWTGADAFIDDVDPMQGPARIITAISRLEHPDTEYTDVDENLKATFMDVEVETYQTYQNTTTVGSESVFGSSVSFIDFSDDNWSYQSVEIIDGVEQNALVSDAEYDNTLATILQVGDCIIAKDGTIDVNENGVEDDKDNYYDTVYVQELGTKYDADGNFKFHYIILSEEPYLYTILDEETGAINNRSIVRIDDALNKEIGIMTPHYLEGYTYKHDRPIGTGMYAKLVWQEFILSALTDYKGLRVGLLNKSEIDYRYVIDTFESFPVTSLKSVLSYLCKEKQSAFCIANFPSVKTFTKCPYASFTDSNGVFNVEYVVKGCNKKKAASVRFGLPSDNEGASFVAFYSPLKFSDGYVDSLIPSAGLVSNLFIEKYMSRQPYYIVAGPNYGAINASGLVGPDYKYSMDELQIIEPFGVNVMVYRPNFGTFINANQTAKQTPVSALSKVNVRELVIYLQDEIEKVLQAYQWEFNNQTTRNAILDKANQICAVTAANGGIQAYRNIMDESNNTPEIIDNEMAIISTHIEPGMGCGKMVQELHLYRTGQMSASIID